MDQEKNKSYESISVTPVIRDVETIFARIFNFIGSIFLYLFSVFRAIFILSVAKLRIISIVVLLSGIVGYLSIHLMPRSYKSSIVVTSLLGTNDQLYADVHYFQSLVKNNSWDVLSNILNITPENAKFINEFEIVPYGNDLDKIKSLSVVYGQLDSSTWNFVDHDKLMESEAPNLFSNHIVTIHSTSPRIFESIETNLLDYFETHEHLKIKSANQKQIYIDRKEVLATRIKNLDKLQETYFKVMMLQAEKQESSSVTNVSMGGENKSQDQDLLALLEKYDNYQGEIDFINKQLLSLDKYYTVVTQLSAEGQKESLGRKGRAAVLAFISYIMCIIFFSLQKALVTKE